jgi:hypothetical protein
VNLVGACQRVQVVGNRIVDSRFGGIDLVDLLPGAADVLLANNTLWRNKQALRIWDDSSKGKAFRECKNIRFQNNLVLEPLLEADLFFMNHVRGNREKSSPGDLQALLDSPEWHFSHNWREIITREAEGRFAGIWIPCRRSDQLRKSIDAGSREPGNADFLRPPKDSPLATAGVDDPALPPYVGAVPPEGVEPWDWDRTWKGLYR